MTETTLRCRSPLQFVSLGPVPPRMPGRTDAQVPNTLDDGPAHYARLGHLYFYDEAKPADPAFGFVDIEMSLQRLGDGDFRCEIYCVGDGYQSGDGHGDGAPLRLQFAAGERVAGTVDWPYPEVRSGTSDPITFRAPIDMTDADFGAIDRVVVPPATAVCRVVLD